MKNKFVKNLNQFLNENHETLKCIPIKLTDAVIDEVSKFETSEELLRAGGISIDNLNRLVFGFSEDDIKTLMPSQLKIKWKEDLENVKYEVEIFKKKNIGKSLLNIMKIWANSINLTEPIDVSYEKNAFYIEDGHHRYYAAKILNKPLNVNLEIKMNPIKKITPTLGYDDFHRCIFSQIKLLNENL